MFTAFFAASLFFAPLITSATDGDPSQPSTVDRIVDIATGTEAQWSRSPLCLLVPATCK